MISIHSSAKTEDNTRVVSDKVLTGLSNLSSLLVGEATILVIGESNTEKLKYSWSRKIQKFHTCLSNCAVKTESNR